MFKYCLFAFVLIAGCMSKPGQDNKSGSGEMTAAEKQKVCNEVEKMLLAYQKDIRDNGMMAEFKYLDSSEDFFWVPPGYNSSIDYDSVVSAVTRNAHNFTKVDNVFTDLRILALSHHLATYTCKIRSEVTMTNGQAHSFTFLETGNLIRRGDDWKMLCGQTNLVQE